MVIRESIEIHQEDTSIKDFKNEIELLKSAGYKVFDETNDCVCFYQSTTVVNSYLLSNRKCNRQPTSNY